MGKQNFTNRIRIVPINELPPEPPFEQIINLEQIPTDFALHQDYPNPFNPTTTIIYELPKESYVTLKVYNVLGQEVVALVNEEKKAGRYEVIFDGSKLSNGLYMYRLKPGEYINSDKLLLIKSIYKLKFN